MLILTVDLPFLHVMLLLKPSVNSQNASSTIMLFHRVPRGVLTKELTSQQEKCDGGPTVLESSSLTIFPINLKQLG